MDAPAAESAGAIDEEETEADMAGRRVVREEAAAVRVGGEEEVARERTADEEEEEEAVAVAVMRVLDVPRAAAEAEATVATERGALAKRERGGTVVPPMPEMAVTVAVAAAVVRGSEADAMAAMLGTCVGEGDSLERRDAAPAPAEEEEEERDVEDVSREEEAKAGMASEVRSAGRAMLALGAAATDGGTRLNGSAKRAEGEMSRSLSRFWKALGESTGGEREADDEEHARGKSNMGGSAASTMLEAAAAEAAAAGMAVAVVAPSREEKSSPLGLRSRNRLGGESACEGLRAEAVSGKKEPYCAIQSTGSRKPCVSFTALLQSPPKGPDIESRSSKNFWLMAAWAKDKLSSRQRRYACLV